LIIYGSLYQKVNKDKDEKKDEFDDDDDIYI
jgi:hypothetical protein